MKKISILSVMLMVIGTTVFAGVESPESSTGIAVVRNGSTFNVFYKSNTVSDVKVSILNNREEIVFTETIRRVDGFIRPYNFSGLAEGEYTIEVNDENGSQVERVNYRLGKIKSLANIIHLKGEQNRYLLTLANKGKEEYIVKIYDKEGILLYKGKELADGDFAKIYNLGKIKGVFSFEITDSKGLTKTMVL